jgi:hypothetical protein
MKDETMADLEGFFHPSSFRHHTLEGEREINVEGKV